MYEEGSCRVLLEVVARHILEGTEEYHRKIRIAGIPSEVRNKYFAKTCLELYCYASSLGRNYYFKNGLI
jgi:hypothetical protein